MALSSGGERNPELEMAEQKLEQQIHTFQRVAEMCDAVTGRVNHSTTCWGFVRRFREQFLTPGYDLRVRRELELGTQRPDGSLLKYQSKSWAQSEEKLINVLSSLA
ncbi:hypothetical protein HPB50_006478 [Hyalomma asiaticum]|uniref:Uncharacterized protein n=1 Tax=Hyalomma asiaticum TaxID=266040 RepID=A0ACB7T0Y1_HYAAI|nr:hypothetical protein HPB50_006478 [Hyalomma asiaticum]